VKFSITLGTGGEGREPAALAGLAALAESSGWDAFLLEDYLCYKGLPTYDPWVCLAAIAAATTRIRIGTTVTPLPRPQPWELAAQAVAVDHLSAGRLILGVGSGAADEPAFAAAGRPMSVPERAARLDEGLHVLTALWTGTPVRHYGLCYRLDGLQLPAIPVQRPRIPIWVGGDLRRPAVRRRLTRWDGACVYRDRALNPADVQDIVTLIHAAGRDLARYDIKVSGNPTQLDELAAAGATWWASGSRPAIPMTPARSSLTVPPATADRGRDHPEIWARSEF